MLTRTKRTKWQKIQNQLYNNVMLHVQTTVKCCMFKLQYLLNSMLSGNVNLLWVLGAGTVNGWKFGTEPRDISRFTFEVGGDIANILGRLGTPGDTTIHPVDVIAGGGWDSRRRFFSSKNWIATTPKLLSNWVTKRWSACTASYIETKHIQSIVIVIFFLVNDSSYCICVTSVCLQDLHKRILEMQLIYLVYNMVYSTSLYLSYNRTFIIS